jgi:branched-chain amino acid transport system ATP-binding protein/branched-chain amino acid transport system permease protein
VLFAAVIIGGAGNQWGAVLGAVLVPVGFEEVTRYIPTSNNLPPNLIPSLEWVAIGVLIIGFLWFRPQGVLPERKRVVAVAAPAGDRTAGWHRWVKAPAVSPEPPGADGGDGQRNASGATARPAPQPDAVGEGRARGDSGSPGPAEPAGAVVLEAVGLSREFGGVRAVHEVSFSVRQGTLTGLIGPNGAGKSTLLAMLAGTLPVSSGKVLYQGDDVTSLAAFRRARVGLVRTFQLASEFKRLTVMENLVSSVQRNRGDSFFGAMGGRRYWGADERAAVERAAGLLERFGLADHANSYAGDLSGGQRRLVEIMRALMAEPRMLLLDEPMAGVHPHLARRIGNELVALCAGGMTILMVEHELAIMDEFCDPVVVMAEGAVLAEGTMQQLRGRQEVVEAYLVG